MSTEEPKRKRGRPSEGARDAILATTLELIGEQGLARLTTKEIARRADVSEASIYYHFADKPALVEGVIFDAVLGPLRSFAGDFAKRAGEQTVEQALFEFASALEGFWERVLPVLSAVQADAELRDRFQTRVNELRLGPHRGVKVIATYLERQQQSGRVRADADVRGAAMLLTGACHLRAYQRHMLGPGGRGKLPSLESTVAALASLLRPPAS